MTPSSHSYGTLVSFPVPDSSQTGPYSDEGEGLISYTIDWIWQKKKKKSEDKNGFQRPNPWQNDQAYI